MASSSSGAFTLPEWIMGSPSSSWRKTSHTRSLMRPASGGGRRVPQERVADPLRVGVVIAPEAEPLLRCRTVAGHDGLQLGPVGLGVVPSALGLVVLQRRIRD